ncbi:hypothetical protein BDV93DRAFT_506428 [Ceratobasidium sp. AG-I]|nr:hypothetical protein BDV93DRAFT_506428 [Ceratobasidium sp. AG-I]
MWRLADYPSKVLDSRRGALSKESKTGVDRRWRASDLQSAFTKMRHTGKGGLRRREKEAVGSERRNGWEGALVQGTRLGGRLGEGSGQEGRNGGGRGECTELSAEPPLPGTSGWKSKTGVDRRWRASDLQSAFTKMTHTGKGGLGRRDKEAVGSEVNKQGTESASVDWHLDAGYERQRRNRWEGAWVQGTRLRSRLGEGSGQEERNGGGRGASTVVETPFTTETVIISVNSNAAGSTR